MMNAMTMTMTMTLPRAPALDSLLSLFDRIMRAVGVKPGHSAPVSSLPEAELIRQVQGGDPGAFQELFRRHADTVYHRLTRMLGPDPEREDLVQEVFLAVHKGLPKFRGDATFSTWLYRIIIHVGYAHMRKGRRRPVLALRVDEADLSVDQGATPEARAATHQELDEVFRCLQKIKPQKRIAFVLRVVEGLSLDEIGRLVDAKPAAVGQRVKHAQKELSALLSQRRNRRPGGGGV